LQLQEQEKDMKSGLHLVLQILLWGICAFNVIVGLGLNLSPDFPQMVAGFYGAQVEWTPAFMYIIKPLGVFMITVGLLAGVAAKAPLQHAPIVYAIALLFLMRGIQRFVFMDDIAAAVSIEAGRNLANGVFFIVLAGVLVAVHRACSKKAA